MRDIVLSFMAHQIVVFFQFFLLFFELLFYFELSFTLFLLLPNEPFIKAFFGRRLADFEQLGPVLFELIEKARLPSFDFHQIFEVHLSLWLTNNSKLFP